MNEKILDPKISLYNDPDLEFIIDDLAYHESGHSLMLTLCPNLGEVDIAGIDLLAGGGFTFTEYVPEIKATTKAEQFEGLELNIEKLDKQQFKEFMLFAVAGTAATNIHIGETDPDFAFSRDLDRLKKAVEKYFEKFGSPHNEEDIDEIFKPKEISNKRFPSFRNLKETFIKKTRQTNLHMREHAVNMTVEKAFDESKRILGENNKALILIAETIKGHGKIDGEEVRQIVQECKNSPHPSDDLG